MAQFSLEACKTSILVEPCESFPCYLEHMKLSVSHRSQDIGSIGATSVDRMHIAENLHITARQDSFLRTCNFPFVLFNKFGHLNTMYIENDYHKGLGCWGYEMNDRNSKLVFVSDFRTTIQSESERLRVREWALQKLIELHYIDTKDLIIVRVPDGDQNRPLEDVYKRNGFRRIGRTAYFAFTKDIQHRSHRIASADDADGYPQFPRVVDGIQDEDSRIFVLHHAVKADSWLGTYLEEKLSLPGDYDAIVSASFINNPASVRKQDNLGYTPFYWAATRHNVSAVKALLRLSPLGIGEDLWRHDNVTGETPLEGCEKYMRLMRESTDFVGLPWEGHSESSLKTLVLLKRAMGEDIRESDRQFIRMRKWGCTCGQCVGGFLSPRMRSRIYAAAQSRVTMMNRLRPSFVVDPSPAIRKFSGYVGFEYIPVAQRSNLNLDYYDQFCGLMGQIGEKTFKNKEFTPTVDNVRSKLGRELPVYPSHGRWLEYLLDCLLGTAFIESPLSEETFDLEKEGDPEWERLTHCANDLEFELVRNCLGLDTRGHWGPFI